uniref:Putative secreted protein n=1 Tax=Anopheles darlingi TaxID=43151 RepID=A0A2M4D5Y7_ANODA
MVRWAGAVALVTKLCCSNLTFLSWSHIPEFRFVISCHWLPWFPNIGPFPGWIFSKHKQNHDFDCFTSRYPLN